MAQKRRSTITRRAFWSQVTVSRKVEGGEKRNLGKIGTRDVKEDLFPTHSRNAQGLQGL